ncbi:MAG: hypothetical protein Ct9H300mP9_6410 [Candidatus Neomarinimicrobiota bacterium]|nr:MAG: hypothetical protein Ct9H300mP9_6410 [Candidatus Neomarinimicrobiota bacterium]
MIIVDPTTIICKPNILLKISLLISGCAENISIKENLSGTQFQRAGAVQSGNRELYRAMVDCFSGFDPYKGL